MCVLTINVRLIRTLRVDATGQCRLRVYSTVELDLRALHSQQKGATIAGTDWRWRCDESIKEEVMRRDELKHIEEEDIMPVHTVLFTCTV